MSKLLDFGDQASGRVVDDNDNFRLVRPARRASGPVCGLFPYSAKHVTVLTASGERLTVRVGT